MLARHVDYIGEAKEIRRVQHDHVQRMTLDPLTTINQPPQSPQLPVDLDAKRALDRMDRAHLIGDRTDAADARHDVRRFSVAAAAQKRFEESRRLKNIELRRADPTIADMQIERAFTLDARKIVDADPLSRHGPRSPSKTA